MLIIVNTKFLEFQKHMPYEFDQQQVVDCSEF